MQNTQQTTMPLQLKKNMSIFTVSVYYIKRCFIPLKNSLWILFGQSSSKNGAELVFLDRMQNQTFFTESTQHSFQIFVHTTFQDAFSAWKHIYWFLSDQTGSDWRTFDGSLLSEWSDCVWIGVLTELITDQWHHLMTCFTGAVNRPQFIGFYRFQFRHVHTFRVKSGEVGSLKIAR